MPPTDQAVAALLTDLDERGLLDDTLVVCMGEFGRTPKINKKAGRDHWPRCNRSCWPGPASARAASTAPRTPRGVIRPIVPSSPADLCATILHLLGVPADLEVRDRTGRPLRACSGSIVSGLLG